MIVDDKSWVVVTLPSPGHHTPVFSFINYDGGGAADMGTMGTHGHQYRLVVDTILSDTQQYK